MVVGVNQNYPTCCPTKVASPAAPAASAAGRRLAATTASLLSGIAGYSTNCSSFTSSSAETMIGIRGIIKTTAPRFATFAFGSCVCTQRYCNLTRSITASNRKGFFHSLFPSSLHYSTRSIHDVPKEDQFQFKTEEFLDQHALALTNKYDDGIVTIVVRVPDVLFFKDAYDMFSQDRRVIYKPPPFIPFLVKVSHNLNLKLWCIARPYEISLDRLKLVSDISNPTALEVMERVYRRILVLIW